ncbi:MAG: hypothetical protein JWP59_2898 [Massilia sp.]|nr:hypothetical protein [Massilia sp.]
MLDWTPVGALSEQVADLKHLKELSVKKCGLTALPSRLPEIKNLRSLNVSFNRIDVLPLSIGELRELESLNICATLVHVLPDSLRKLSKLIHLDISGTPLTTLPEWVGTMVSLTNIVAAKLWHIKKVPRYEGKTISTYLYALTQPDGEGWLESLGWPRK